MIYFKQVSIDNFLSENENKIRRYSSKRYTSLDLTGSSYHIKDDKCFLGFEGKNDVDITRIRTLFERVLPKLIVSFPKDKGFSVYRMRYSLLSTVVFCVLLFGLLEGIFTLVTEQEWSSDFLTIAVLFLGFILLTFLEMRLTRQLIDKVVLNK